MVYADYWIALQEGHLTYGTFEDYKSIINRHIKPSMKGLRMRDVLPDDITRMMKEVANFSKSVHDKTYMLAKQIVKAEPFCPEIAGLFCHIAGLFCHSSRTNLSLKPACFDIAIS